MSEGSRRTTRELRDGLAARRAQIEKDFKALGVRFEEATNVRRLLTRHPVLAVTAGSLLGVLLVRRPAFLVAVARRAATWGVPLLVSAVSERLARR